MIGIAQLPGLLLSAAGIVALAFIAAEVTLRLSKAQPHSTAQVNSHEIKKQPTAQEL